MGISMAEDLPCVFRGRLREWCDCMHERVSCKNSGAALSSGRLHWRARWGREQERNGVLRFFICLFYLFLFVVWYWDIAFSFSYSTFFLVHGRNGIVQFLFVYFIYVCIFSFIGSRIFPSRFLIRLFCVTPACKESLFSNTSFVSLRKPQTEREPSLNHFIVSSIFISSRIVLFFSISSIFFYILGWLERAKEISDTVTVARLLQEDAS